MTKSERENATNLQQYLRDWWWSKKPGPLTSSYLSENAESMTFIEGDNTTVRKLSKKGREFIRTGGVLLVGEEESFLESE
jgi:hypothetical protein